MSDSRRILQELLSEWDALVRALGSGDTPLLAVLDELHALGDLDAHPDEELDAVLDRVLALGLFSAARDVFRDVVRRTRPRGPSRGLEPEEREEPSTRSPSYSLPLPLPAPAPPAPAGRADDAGTTAGFRYVNVCLSTDREVVPAAVGLKRGGAYELRLDIGALSPESVVEEPEQHPFPDEFLPPSDDGHWLEVVVVSGDFSVDTRRRHLFLPRTGASWVCHCVQGGRHSCTAAARSPYLYVPVLAPDRRGRAALRLAIYYEKNLVQSQLLTAAVGGDAGGCASVVDYTLTAGLSDVGRLPPRSVNLLTNDSLDGSHRIVINGRGDEVATFQLTEGQMAGAVTALRSELRDIHIEQVGNAQRNRYDKNNAKPRAQFAADVARLAVLGWRLWNTLVAHDPDLRARLRAALKPGAATIQVARTGRSTFVFPWALVYDIPLESRADRHRPCRLLSEWEPDAPPVDGGGPAACPYAEEHGLNVICPYGFWGYAHVIEQPPSMPPGRALPLVIRRDTRGAQLLVGMSLELDERLLVSHMADLKARMASFSVLDCDTVDEISRGLAESALERVYFYCHGRSEQRAGTSVPVLGVGRKEQITPDDLVAWADGLWPTDHWSSTAPLVVINGCHTAALTPDALVSFVDAFAGLRAAGVVGTEIAIHQQVAGEAAVELLAGVQDNQPVGEALQRMRRHLLSKGNVLGLAYTTYCSASLQLSG